MLPVNVFFTPAVRNKGLMLLKQVYWLPNMKQFYMPRNNVCVLEIFSLNRVGEAERVHHLTAAGGGPSVSKVVFSATKTMNRFASRDEPREINIHETCYKLICQSP